MKTLPISPHSSNITGNAQKASKNEYEGQREQQKGILAPVEASTATKDDDMGHDEVLEPEVHGVTEARCPPTMRSPHLPTQKERESHERTHVPYRSWCKICNEAEARESPHRRNAADKEGEEAMPTIVFDYNFYGEGLTRIERGAKESETDVTAIVMKDCKTGTIWAHTATCKGPGTSG